ncbi:hypothetical protein DJ82_09265 [Halorubrum sp. Ib24]|uniref:DCC1-like thiol-disulfide oxidoreductase family protein n=1 Tax=Halorubrum sp. Ib24 TaxID=1383850 RepID=UPI000B982FF7|nr:DCC1-like thiol-disulfide oxidoreductase family protein [Halorubrum sp. Ib24]OYR39677.1 hypothetical protein DJ82_09265 [Halorubrum sp. Ib24]
MFVNYASDPERDSPINLTAARGITGFWLVWKTAMYDWPLFLTVPYYQTPEYAWAVPPVAPGLILTVEKWLLIGLLVGFVVGYRIRFTAVTGALLLAHLAVVRATLVGSGETEALYIGVYFLILFALFHDSEGLSVDFFRRTKHESLETLRHRLESDGASYRMPALKWCLIVIAIIYFGAGYDKVFHDGLLNPSLEFAAADNLARIVTTYRPDGPLKFVAEYPLLTRTAGIGTLVLELGFLIAVLAKISITPIILGLLSFTASNRLLLGIHFVDVYFILLLFASWDIGFKRLIRHRGITVVFDEQCRTCMRALTPFALLDVSDSIEFYSQSEAPSRYAQRTDIDMSSGVCVFRDGDRYEGYDAGRELLDQYRCFVPIVWVMRLSFVEHVTARVYGYVARKGDRNIA